MIEISDISKTYNHQGHIVYALKDVSLSIEKGDIYGIIGLSGAGKSTLIRCLARLITPDTGHIIFHGKDITHIQGKKLRHYYQNIGMIFQHFNLLNGRTVAENIAYPLEISDAPQKIQGRVAELLKLVGLSQKASVYPARLSGGEKQRVGIARALAHCPDLLLCDEATSALDPKTTQEILTLLKKIHQTVGITIVLITHEMEVIKQICNKVAVIDQGEILEAGSVADIFADPKYDITKSFVQNTIHDIPQIFIDKISATCKLLRLRFTGETAKTAIISNMIKTCQVDANILLGWIDNLQTATIGTLVIELTGSEEQIHCAIQYLQAQSVHCEIINK